MSIGPDGASRQFLRRLLWGFGPFMGVPVDVGHKAIQHRSEPIESGRRIEIHGGNTKLLTGAEWFAGTDPIKVLYNQSFSAIAKMSTLPAENTYVRPGCPETARGPKYCIGVDKTKLKKVLLCLTRQRPHVLGPIRGPTDESPNHTLNCLRITAVMGAYGSQKSGQLIFHFGSSKTRLRTLRSWR
jgi:hypothetical protein